MAKIYLTAQRKCWYHELPEGWEEIAFERFNYIECGIFEKKDSELTDEDLDLIKWYGQRPEEWVEPEKMKQIE